jgi:2-haloacid dehalogenase
MLLAMPADIRAISFDCYGTLIDWQSGLRSALRPALAEAGIFLDDGALFHSFSVLERRAQQPPFENYKFVLESVVAGLFEYPERIDLTILWKSLREWPAFDEVPGVLRALKKRHRLAVVSNIDDDLFAWSESKLDVALDEVVTAEQVRSYKPALPHFHELLRRLDLKPEQILHVAESRYHDIEPANLLGIPCVWVDRSGDKPSASGPGEGRPTCTVRSLSELPSLLA